jgi:hypothetical protein
MVQVHSQPFPNAKKIRNRLECFSLPSLRKLSVAGVQERQPM